MRKNLSEPVLVRVGRFGQHVAYKVLSDQGSERTKKVKETSSSFVELVQIQWQSSGHCEWVSRVSILGPVIADSRPQRQRRTPSQAERDLTWRIKRDVVATPQPPKPARRRATKQTPTAPTTANAATTPAVAAPAPTTTPAIRKPPPAAPATTTPRTTTATTNTTARRPRTRAARAAAAAAQSAAKPAPAQRPRPRHRLGIPQSQLRKNRSAAGNSQWERRKRKHSPQHRPADVEIVDLHDDDDDDGHESEEEMVQRAPKWKKDFLPRKTVHSGSAATSEESEGYTINNRRQQNGGDDAGGRPRKRKKVVARKTCHPDLGSLQPGDDHGEGYTTTTTTTTNMSPKRRKVVARKAMLTGQPDGCTARGLVARKTILPESHNDPAPTEREYVGCEPQLPRKAPPSAAAATTTTPMVEMVAEDQKNNDDDTKESPLAPRALGTPETPNVAEKQAASTTNDMESRRSAQDKSRAPETVAAADTNHGQPTPPSCAQHGRSEATPLASKTPQSETPKATENQDASSTNELAEPEIMRANPRPDDTSQSLCAVERGPEAEKLQTRTAAMEPTSARDKSGETEFDENADVAQLPFTQPLAQQDDGHTETTKATERQATSNTNEPEPESAQDHSGAAGAHGSDPVLQTQQDNGSPQTETPKSTEKQTASDANEPEPKSAPPDKISETEGGEVTDVNQCPLTEPQQDDNEAPASSARQTETTKATEGQAASNTNELEAVGLQDERNATIEVIEATGVNQRPSSQQLSPERNDSEVAPLALHSDDSTETQTALTEPEPTSARHKNRAEAAEIDTATEAFLTQRDDCQVTPLAPRKLHSEVSKTGNVANTNQCEPRFARRDSRVIEGDDDDVPDSFLLPVKPEGPVSSALLRVSSDNRNSSMPTGHSTASGEPPMGVAVGNLRPALLTQPPAKQYKKSPPIGFSQPHLGLLTQPDQENGASGNFAGATSAQHKSKSRWFGEIVCLLDSDDD